MVACMPVGLHPIGDSGSIRYGVNYDKGKGNMMINKFKTLRGCQLDGLDGEIGAVREFYFDDLDWAIRYLVADTGDWLKGRQVLISPNALARAIQDARSIAIGLTQEQIENSPLLNIDMPVSRQFEAAYYGYYGWPAYWSGSPLWGTDTERGCERENRRKSTQGTTTPDELHLHITADIWSCHIVTIYCHRTITYSQA